MGKDAISGQYTITFVNTATGAATTKMGEINSANNATVTWTPPAAGTYQITARFEGSSNGLPATSNTITYYAPAWKDLKKNETETLYVLEMTGSTYGDQINATLKSYSGGENDPVPFDGNVSYAAYSLLENKDQQWKNSDTLLPGSYKIVATVGDEVKATHSLTVAKRALTITAPTEPNLASGEASPDKLPTLLAKITVKETGETTDTEYSLNNDTLYGKEEVGYPNLFQLTSNPELSSSGGQYRLDVGFVDVVNGSGKEDEEKVAVRNDFLSKFIPTFQPGTASVAANTVSITCTWGENGRMQLMDGQQDLIGSTGDPGSKVLVDADKTVTFWSQPDAGFRVSQWKINNTVVTNDNKIEGVTLISNGDPLGGLQLDLKTYLDKNPNATGLTVDLAFTNQQVKVNYSASENGTVTAKQGDTKLDSGVNISYGTDVIFTATPESGHVVTKWIVNGETWTNADGSTYTSNTLTLKSITEDTEVKVEFEATADCTVNFEVADENGNASSGATLTAKKISANGDKTSLDSGNTVTKGESVVFTAVEDVGFKVLYWQVKREKNDGTEAKFETVKDSGGEKSYTLNNVQENTSVRAVVSSSANTYKLTFGVVDKDGPVSENDVSLTATSGGKTLATGQSQTAYTDVTFKLELSEAYEFVKWTVNNEVATETSTSYTLEKPSAETEVKAVVKKKPKVNIENAENGTVNVVYTLNGDAVEPTEKGYVPNGTDLTVTLTPNKGYEVGEIAGQTLAYTDGTGKTTDAKTFQIQNVTTDQTITPVWTAIPQHTVTYSVVTPQGADSANGSLSASLERKSLNDYKVKPFNTNSSAYRDSVITFQADPSDGYRVKEWNVNGVVQKQDGITIIGNTLAVPVTDEALTVTVQFMRQGGKVTAAAGTGGCIASAVAGGQSVMGNLESGFVLSKDAAVTITAEPNAGYEVYQWKVNNVPVEGQTGTTFTYTAQENGADSVISVTFRQVTYSVDWSGTNGAVQANGYTSSPANIRGGETVIFTAEPDNGYALRGWTVNGTAATEGASGNEFTWTVPNGKAANPAVDRYQIKALFGRGSYTVTLEQPGNGTVTANKDLTNVDGGTQITFTAQPDNGYIVTGWLVNNTPVTGTGNSYTCTVEGETTVKAVIVPSHYDVTYGTNGEQGGIISATGFTASPAKVAYGKSITFTAKPNQYYHVSGWKVDGEMAANTANQETFTLENVTAGHTVTVVFAGAVSYEVGYAVDGQNGSLAASVDGNPLTLTPGTKTNVLGGKTVTFSATPTANLMVKEWKISTDGGTTYKTVTRENMESLGVSMDHYLSNTLTVKSLNSALDVKVSFVGYEGVIIPTGGTGYTIDAIERKPNDTTPNTEIRKNGDLTFTVTPNGTAGYTNITSLTVNGYDCIANSGTADNITAVKNADGSYTVTITGVSGITLQAKAHKVIVGDLVVPDALKDHATLNTTTAIQTALETKLVEVKGGTAFYDIALKYYDADKEEWIVVDEKSFPANGVNVLVKYPGDSDKKDTFSITHMLTTAGHAGEVEVIKNYEKTDEGLLFHVTSLSPFAIGWTKYKETPVDPGGGGGGVVAPSYTLTFDTNGGSALEAVKEEEGTTIDLAKYVPVKDGFVFAGWYADEDLTQLVTSLKLTGDATVYAKWTPAGAEELPFVDVRPGDWFYDSVAYVYENGMMGGVSADRFDPNGTTTRGMIVTILYRLEGEPAVTEPAGFTDVEPGQWYSDAIAWAAANGVVNGMSETTFVPNGNITREQMAAILYRYAQHKGYDVSDRADLSVYTDANQVSPWAQEAMAWANAAGLINGVGSDTLDPTGSATRAQAAAIFMRFCENTAT